MVKGSPRRRTFSLWRGHFGSGASQPWCALALLAVMVGEQDPLDALHADIAEVVEHAAFAQVNEQRGISVAHDIHVAGVGPDEEVGRQLCVHWRQLGCRGLEDEPSQ
jgi:hypothetical protein